MKRTFLIFLILCICTHDLSRAKEIKPGIVINEGNYTEYLPELKKLLTPGYLTDIIMALKNGWITFPVVEKKNYPPAEHFHRATLNNVGRYKVARDNRLIGKPSWKAGLPFLPPRTAAEVAWNVYKRREYGDQMSYYAPFHLFDLKTARMERSFTWTLFKRDYIGRTVIPPIPEETGNNGLLNGKESIIILEPYDVRGLCHDKGKV